LAEILESSGAGERRRAREFALQLLFQLDLSPEPAETAIESFWTGKRIKRAVVDFANDLVRGASEWKDWIDSVLGTSSHHWRVSRMAVVDRNILRLALYEMIVSKRTPPIVVINEAIEIAKKFGNEDSGPFINGILDAVRMRLARGEIESPSAGPDPSPAKLRTPV